MLVSRLWPASIQCFWHRRQLLDQWIERLATFLDLPTKSVGRIGGGRNKPTGLLDVAVIQSLIRKDVVNDCIAEYGQVIVDECHHLSAHSFEQVVRRATARFVLGLSATVTRKDGHHPIIFMQCGSVRHRVDAKAQAAARPFEHTVIVRPTTFQTGSTAGTDKRIEFQSLYQLLVDDETRNRAICEEVVQAVRDGRSPLILTERNEHLDRFESVRLSRAALPRRGFGQGARLGAGRDCAGGKFASEIASGSGCRHLLEAKPHGTIAKAADRVHDARPREHERSLGRRQTCNRDGRRFF